ncbi:MAG: xylulokinase, partial [Armatimonadota bacterium]|nr:xylulokinase [Armatimonadota bacterium]
FQASAEEGPAFGVALLAGVGLGAYASVQEACARTIAARQVTPEPSGNEAAAYDAYYRLYQALYPRLRELFADTARLVERGSV